MTPSGHPDLSIVSSMYCSSPHLEEFHARASAAASNLVGDAYEIVLVNDGSPDDSLDIALRLGSEDSHVKIVDLSRNFGHHKAMMTGLAQASGALIYLTDCDLEESPEWVAEFAEQLKQQRCDVVYGVQSTRKGGLFERWSGYLFYRLFNLLSGVKMPENIVVARLMTRRYVDALLRYEEREVYLAGIWQIVGFDQRPRMVAKASSSATTYTMRRKLSILVNSITSFSNLPLRAIFYIGAIISSLSGAAIAYLLFQRLFLARPLDGWTSVMASIWFLGGLVISFIGVIGIYLAKIFSETKRRPYTTIRHIYGRGDGP